MPDLSPIANELACLMLSGLSVEFEDARGLVIQGTGSVLLPGKHSIREVVLNEAVEAGFEAGMLELLSDAFGELTEDPPAACFTRLKEFRMLVVVIEHKNLDRLLNEYASLWGFLFDTDHWDVALFTADSDGKNFKQVSLSDAYSKIQRPAF